MGTSRIRLFSLITNHIKSLWGRTVVFYENGFRYRRAFNVASLFIVVFFSLCLINASAKPALGGWQTQLVDSARDVGEYTSLAFDASGNPAISYYDSTNRKLKYVHDANGDGDFADTGEKITVDSAGFVGLYTCLAFDVSGNPAISYFDYTNDGLKYAHDANGDGDFADAGEIITVDSRGDVGVDTSLAFDASGNPAISYYDYTYYKLKYAHDANGDGDFADKGEIITVDSTGDVGKYNSLAFDLSGNPAISYYDDSNYDDSKDNLKYAHDVNGDGDFADAGEIVTIDSTGDVGRYTSLAFDMLGNPAISYYDFTNGDLKYTHYTHWDTETVDSAGIVGWHTSLDFEASGSPAISYYDLYYDDLKYAHDANGDGDFADKGEIITVDSAGEVGWYTSLAFDALGNPAISYYDYTNGDLKYARDANGDGDFADKGEIITVDSAGKVGLFTSLAFDALGNPAISYYDVTKGDLKYAHDANGDGDFADAGEIITVDSAGTVGLYTSLAFHPVLARPSQFEG